MICFYQTYGMPTQREIANKAVHQALKTGFLVRPATCEECDNIMNFGNRTLHSAHYNYDEPLRIRWLCASCHKTWDTLRAQVASEHNEKTLAELYAIVSAARHFSHVAEQARQYGRQIDTSESFELPLAYSRGNINSGGSLLRAARAALDLKQSELADQANISQSWLSRAESGRAISPEASQALASVFAEHAPTVMLRPGETLADFTNRVRQGGTSGND